ncbi:MAG: ABC transporter permease [Lentisphaeria bacterium]|nr:ABC transporter permease [Lentisphaeria bacterium]
MPQAQKRAPPEGAPPEAPATPPGASLWRDAWRRLRRNRMAVAGAGVFLFMCAASLVGPWLSHYAYADQNLPYGPRPPSWTHWFGTDTVGRDLLVRVLHGGRISLAVGFLATAVSMLIGVLYGAVSGYCGGRTDALMMRLVDVLYALPFTVFVILLTVVFGQDIRLLFVAIGAVQWLTMARIVRAQVRGLRQREFIEAAVGLGLSMPRVVLRHVVPNVLGPIVVYATLTVPAVMLLEAMLSFLGLGVQPPMSSWGWMIKEGAEKMEAYPWMLLFPALCFSLTLFALNFVGDGLRDALDPRSSED